MSIVKKMSISGIRSFNPNDSKMQYITFQTPLTLILGVNGSGKTTIIESLKYAITNTFPPNSKNGSSFVNDPKLGNNFETMGIVRLEVLDSRGNKVQTSRRVKVTVKDKMGNLTKKEMDSTIKITDVKGCMKEISSKCADTKVEMCRIMGVSEAILNTVILCHQEDSCWPLDEGKKVKEKFDAIFNTTMYIKCLDLLRKQDIDLGQRAKMENEKLSYCIDNRKISRRKKKELEGKTIELQSVNDRIESQEKELKEMETKLRQLRELESEYVEISNKVAVTQGKLESIQKQVTELKSKIKEEVDGDISSIEESIHEFAAEQRSKLSRKNNLQDSLRGKEDELKKLTAQQNMFLVEEGKFQQEDTANKERVEIVISLISDVVKLVKKLKEGSQDMSFSSSMDSCIEVCDTTDPRTLSPEIVAKALASAVRARETEINKLKNQYDKDENELQTSIDILRSRKAALETEIELKNKQIKENNSSVEDIRRRLRDIEGSNAALEDLEYEENKVIKEIDAIQDSGALEKYDGELKRLAKEIVELDNQFAETNDDFDILSRDKGLLDQIEIYNNQKLQKKNDCHKILSRIEDDLSTVLGNIPEDNLERTFDEKRDSVITELASKKSKQKEAEKKVTVLQTDLKRAKNELTQKETEFDRDKDGIADVLEGLDFDEAYNDVKEKLEEAQKNNYFSEAAVFLYRKHITKLTKSNCCPLCKRDTENQNQTKDIIQKIEEDIERVLQNEPTEKAKLEALLAKEKDLMDLKPDWDRHKRLEKEIPELKSKVSTLETQLAEHTENMEDLNLLVAELETSKSIFDRRSRDVHLIESGKNEIKQRETNISKLESNRNIRAKELSETTNLSNVKSQLLDLKNSLRAKQSEKDSKSNLLNKTREDLNKLNGKKNDAKQKILKITSELQNREALEVQKKTLESTNKQILEESSSLKQDIPKIKTDISEAERAKSTFVENKDKHLSSARAERDSLDKQKTKLNEIGQQIQEFDRKKSQFSDMQKRASTCKRKYEDMSSQKNELEKDLKVVSDSIATQETKKRNLEDNLEYKKKLKEISKIKSELEEKKKLFESTQNQGVTAEKRQIEQKHADKFAQMNRLMGGRKEIQMAIGDLKKELNERPYSNAETEYLEKLVKKTVYEKAQKDVRRYKTALDQAIMMFHKQRMEMINRSLWEYWRRIYKGNDIDYIQIRTDAGDAAGTGGNKVKIDTGKTRKSYNYRVVMVRQGIELDMRGRCSAGQRVLASIIIRIALADSFSARCGIITLDEPTTNLDQKNINSLADALSSLADKMSSRKNFQLIVITHDQEFTQRLSSVDAVEEYWKVSRDNMGYSQITMVPKRG